MKKQPCVAGTHLYTRVYRDIVKQSFMSKETTWMQIFREKATEYYYQNILINSSWKQWFLISFSSLNKM